ncbi:MAG: alanine racemase [Alphaproteobacteria bacterium]|nr:alanine racemase [Alphaproteobacteria bacterium]
MQPLLASETESLPSHCTGFLEIDTRAIIHNYHTLQALLPDSFCAAVLKADAYGFGINAIAPILEKEGCTVFFVAHLEEGIFLRSFLKNTQIYVLSGILPGTESLFVEHRLTPVLNDINMVKKWVLKAQQQEKKLSCALHFDTGMHRSGFDQKETIQLFNSCNLLDAVKVDCVMSHLSSSHDLQSPLNEKQRNLFETLRRRFPDAKASLADTGGIYLGAPYHYDIARPGKGLFGLYKAPPETPALTPCLKLFARVLQIRNVPQGESVGYGATHTLSRDSKLATLGIGFADGYDRRLSNKGAALIQGFKAPVVGRISMDYTVIDVTDVPESLCFTGGWVELVNELFTLDHLAESIETISRELSTGFGRRLQRVYK